MQQKDRWKITDYIILKKIGRRIYGLLKHQGCLGFYSISTLNGYLMPNLVYTNTLDMICKQIVCR